MENFYNLQPIIPEEAEAIIKKFYNKINKTSSPKKIADYISTIIQSNEFSNLAPENQISLKLFLQVIQDTTRQGWVFQYKNDTLQAFPPNQSNDAVKDAFEIKNVIKHSLQEARNEQINEPSKKAFIFRMERIRKFKDRNVSVLNHFLDPKEYYNDLIRRVNAPEQIREELISRSIQPYIQLVDDSRDSFTNIKLKDIWRYARYSWSLPLSSQPGREMKYLVRDASRDFHPIMGIGALGNSTAQISCRDNAIGWTLESLQAASNLPERLFALKNHLEIGISNLYTEDLLSSIEIKKPSEETLAKLKNIIDSLKNTKTNENSNTDNFLNDALKPEYRLKRAIDLEELLQARFMFNLAEAQTENDLEVFHYLLNTNDGKRALKNSIKNIKKGHMGSAIMDITTCGAIPPYNDILGGKLVSLLMASPKVINDYHKKYSEAVSEIASRKKGGKIVKPAHLALMATTSLYYTGSSQYNRIKYTTQHGTLKYNYVGNTKGFGSVHLSARTYKTLQDLLEQHPDLERVSSTFSAGVNYKMRSIAKGLAHIGMSKLHQHENPRLVYIIPLLQNWQEYLTGVDTTPSYIYDMNRPDDETAEIIKYWKKRWYSKRVLKTDILQKWKSQKKLKISDFIDAHSEVDLKPITKSSDAYQLELLEGEFMSSGNKLSWKDLADLNENRTSFAERLSDEELEILHIDTKLDNKLINLLNSNKRIYLVGNPGDGKTHIIRRYEKHFPPGTITILDASAVEENLIIEDLKRAIQESIPVVIAINEGPLRKILSQLPESETNMLKSQLNEPLISPSDTTTTSDVPCILINLGLRENLTGSILESALEIVLNKVDYNDAPEIMKYNVAQLKRDRIQKRLITLLDYVRKSGHHLTMNQILGFLSYVITSGINNSEKSSKIDVYFNSIFSKANPLFNKLEAFDPFKITHPIIDMDIYDSPTIPDLQKLIDQELVPNLDFSGLKRYFYFDNENGLEILNMIPSEYQSFYSLLDKSVPLKKAKSKIIAAISSFFENSDNTEKLQIWTSLKYEAKKEASVFVSSQSISEEQISVYIPQLRPELKDLIEYEPHFIRLQIQPNAKEPLKLKLDINLELWLSMMKSKRGISNFYQDPLIIRRLTTFMSKLSVHLSKNSKEEAVVIVLDTESGEKYTLPLLNEDGKGGKYDW